MAAEGGPNISEDGLVFYYDTGNGKSYKGEPTENLASTDSSRTMITHAGSSTFSDAPEKGPGWKKITITARSSNFRVTRFPYIRQPSNTTRTYSVELDFGTTSGYYVRGDGFTGFGSSSSTNGIYSTTFTTTSNAGVLALFLNNNTTSVSGISDVIYYRYYQVEDKPHRTPFTEGTRSATQGLLDLTGTGTISIDNASYSSNAQKTFDGADDYISTSNSYNGSNSLSVEAVFKTYSLTSPGNQNIVFNANGQGLYPRIWKDSSNRITVQYRPSGTTTSIQGSYYISANTFYHILFTYDAVTGGILYLNGNVIGTNTNVTGNHEKGNGHAIRIGNDTNINYYMNGEIPMVKKYNRVLTADEVHSNYNAIKSRFGL